MRKFGTIDIECSNSMLMSSAITELKELPYRSLNIKCLELLNDKSFLKIRRILQRYEWNVEELRVHNFEMNRLVDFLISVPNLAHLELKDCFQTSKITKIKIDFPNLKCLKIWRGSEFVNLIKSHQIQSLTLKVDKSVPANRNWKKFLGTCDKLIELVIFNYNFNFHLTDFNFHLAKLEIHGCYQQEKFEEFLITQKETLKVLRLFSVHFEGIYEFVAFNLAVEEFQLTSTIKGIMLTQQFNQSIKNIKLDFRIFDLSSLEYYYKVVLSLQAVETLEIILPTNRYEDDQFSIQILKFVVFSMPKLKTLILNLSDNINFWLLDGLKDERIERVENLSIGIYNPSNSIYSLHQTVENINFLNIFPNVKLLKLKNILKVSSVQLETIIKSLIYLKEIHVEGRIHISDSTADLILNSKIKKIMINNVYGVNEIPEKLENSKIKICIKKI